MVSKETAIENTHYIPEDSLLELTDVSVRYGVVAALSEVSLGVAPGEMIAVMGPNGAGKSTVLKAIMGLAPVVEGKVWWRKSRWRRRPMRSCGRAYRSCPKAGGCSRT